MGFCSGSVTAAQTSKCSLGETAEEDCSQMGCMQAVFEMEVSTEHLRGSMPGRAGHEETQEGK